MNHNFMSFLFEHWQAGTIGVVIVLVILAIGVVIAIREETK